ncbi:hypothetical protein [Actinomadura gamaensis]|uniref:Integral membrane protein n=1 Tax=Actinomadura gamaensis TaxID=1763541 RepID=A0ABV9TU13_9ACTN
MFRTSQLNRNTLAMFAGLLVGIVGLVVQWIADPAKFSEAVPPLGKAFPPGIAFIVGAALLTLLTARWWWHAVFGAFIGFWIVGVGTIAGQLTPNLTSHNAGTVAGNAIMAVGLASAVVTGVLSMVTARRARRTVRTAPAPARQRQNG